VTTLSGKVVLRDGQEIEVTFGVLQLLDKMPGDGQEIKTLHDK
jgi:hypothetical protein